MPQLVQRDAEGLGLGFVVEVEVDNDVVRIVHRPQHPVAAHARLLAANRIAVEGLLPCAEVEDCVLDLQGGHGRLVRSTRQ